jgi:hypothetical protein
MNNIVSLTIPAKVPSQTYSFANDKFKQSNEIIVIKIEESLIVVVKIKL